MDHLAAVVLALLDGEGFLMRDETIVQTDLITGAARDDDRVALALECRGGVGVELPGGVRRTARMGQPSHCQRETRTRNRDNGRIEYRLHWLDLHLGL
ncbi:hypothetical protein B9M78_03720 [Mycobacteroides abscessus]|nr:hypothetical protein B9M78_03720 [Mycobacteroides abscessus]